MRVLLAVALLGCDDDSFARNADGGAEGEAESESEAEAEGEAESESEAEAESCATACDSPPAPVCYVDPKGAQDPCRALAYDPAGACVGGECAYISSGIDCAFGCDEATGACRDEGAFCAGLDCGTAQDCGGLCVEGDGCCVPVTYTVSSGFTASGTTICCDEGDVATAVIDCGDGEDHWVAASGKSCGTAYEGSENYGGPCVALECAGTDCPTGGGTG